jgi:hypothetical protein
LPVPAGAARDEHGVLEDLREARVAITAQHADRTHHVLAAERRALARQRVELLQQRAAERHHVVVADERQLAAARVRLHPQLLLQDAEVRAAVAQDGLGRGGVVERELLRGQGAGF